MTQAFNPYLHGLRGLAALAVVLFHWVLTYPEVFIDNTALGLTLIQHTLSLGWVGVLLFFVLSGYLLGGHLQTSSLCFTNCRYFWLRRICRIYPAVWAQYAILLLLVALGVQGLTSPETLGDGVLNFFLLINLPPLLPRSINLVWWTLPIELSFYLLLPLLTLAIRKTGWLLFGVITLVACIAWRIIIMYVYREAPSYGPVQPIIDLLPGALFSFTAGMCVAALPYKFRPATLYGILIVALVLVCGLSVWLLQNVDSYWTGHWMLAVWNPLMSIPLALLVLCCTQAVTGLGFLATRPAVWLGELSFGIYLWHFPVLVIINAYFPKWRQSPSDGLLALAIIIISSLLLAQLSFWLIERPAMNWKRKTSRETC